MESSKSAEARFSTTVRQPLPTHVPEHSVPLMRALSGGEPLRRDGYLFFVGGGWLVAVGYPEQGSYDAARFLAALRAVARKTQARDCWAVAPRMPPELRAFVDERDICYVLPAGAPVPARLRGPVRGAAARLRIDETRRFTAAHRRLWAEFLRRRPLPQRVAEVLARTPAMLEAPGGDIRLCNAWDRQGNLAACCVVDHSPASFNTYVTGAHSRAAYTPHAVDALFAAMLEGVRAEGKDWLHLGLGATAGIRRFKLKWGALPAQTYEAAAWRKEDLESAWGLGRGDAMRLALAAFRASGRAAPRQEDRPERARLAMLWKVECAGKVSWLGGTSHLFSHSFADSFRALFRRVDTVLFEGPLDPASLAVVAARGSAPGPGPRLSDLLTEEEIRRLERVVRGPQGRLARWANVAWPRPADVRGIVSTHRPWSVFFTLYYAFLERQGWRQSVDLEAWRLAHEMGRHVVCMESIEDQIRSLESVPLERILRFLRHPEDWGRQMRQGRRAYLAGDLERMQGVGTEFPTRTERVIDARDNVFLQAMLPWLAQGGAAAFVGTAHLFRLRGLLRDHGCALAQVPRTLAERWRAALTGGF